MNTSIETLNHWGQDFLNFAWPMLWQSSLLIVVVATLDFLLARKIRASIRHALWLVVLVKLLLPPALALPTGAAWWLWPAKPQFTPEIKTETVTFDTTALPPEDFVPASVPMPAPPPPKLNGLGWAMLASSAISAGLLFSLLVNWLKVARKTHRAHAYATTSCDFANPLEQARQLAGLRRPMRLKLVDDAISPAVYGLFRPVILLPRALAEKLFAAQLRAVLLHEAVHLRRGDVWVNCAQTLLQIAYWWHPLLWLANARIRRLREEAVDDAVMLALRGDADAYAPTLLEVAKFAFRRPLASLGLVGILESRSALRQRVERLVDFRPPRRAGLTFLSLCGIFLFGAVTLPMGQAPAATTDSASTEAQSSPASVPFFSRTNVVIQGSFFWMRSTGLPRNGEVSQTILNNLDGFNQSLHSLNLKPFQRPRITIAGYRQGAAANFYSGTRTNWITLDCAPIVTGERIELDVKAVVGSVSPDGETNRIELNGHATMENNGGMILSTQLPNDASSNLVLVIGVKTVEAATASLNIESNTSDPNLVCCAFKLEKPIRKDDLENRLSEAGVNNIPPTYYVCLDNGDLLVRGPAAQLASVLRVVREVNGYSSKAVDPAAFQTAPKQSVDSTGSPIYEMRTFRFDTNTFYSILKKTVIAGPNSPRTASALTKQFFSRLGVDINPPKTLFFNDRLGVLFVYATPQDLDVIERAFQVLNDGNHTATTGPYETNKIVMTSPGRMDIYQKLNRIHLDTVSFQALPLSEVLGVLREQSQRRDPDKAGINFIYNPNIEPSLPAEIDPNTGLPIKQAPVPPSVDPTQINITLNVTDVSLANLLDAICMVSDHPIKYSITESGIVFSPKDRTAAQYEMRTFYVYSSKFYSDMREKWLSSTQTGGGSVTAPNVISLLKENLQSQGVNLEPPENLFFHDVWGGLFVYATPHDLDVIERTLGPMNAGSVGQQAAAIARDGQQLYYAGRLDEAQAKLKEALARDPCNQGAQYYLNLINSKLGPYQPAKVVINPTNLWDPQQNDENHYSKQWAGDNLFAAQPPSFLNQVVVPVNVPNLITNDFRYADIAALRAAVLKETGQSDVIEGFKEIAARAGVDLSPPTQVLIPNDWELSVVATSKDMGKIIHILEGLHCLPWQIHIKARFIEVPQTFLDDERNSIPTAVTNGGVLTNPQFQKFLHQLQRQQGPQELAEPEVTTIFGRQTQMRATIIQPIRTGGLPFPASTARQDHNLDPQTQDVETGPILDVLPKALPDSYTLDLTAVPALIKFFGYADTRGLPPRYETNSDGQTIEVPNVLPAFGVAEEKAEIRLYDGQTAVLLPKPDNYEYNGDTDDESRERIRQQIREEEKKDQDKQLIVLVTVTLIDVVGNRIHSDADMSFARNKVPQQPIIWSGSPAVP